MRYKGRRQSSNIEDRRGMSTGKKVGLRGGLFAVVALVVYVLLGGDPQMALNFLQGGTGTAETATGYEPTAHEEELAEFVAVVLADTEDV
jgi:uncharacterized protein